MRIIKVDAINSTNTFLRTFYRENASTENLCVLANEQTMGRGQMGAGWKTEKGKNLTFSLLFTKLDIGAKMQFKLSALTGLAILEVLKNFGIADLRLKWPNDILAGNFKIGGVLIENFLKGDKIHASIIGIGLNVNQEKFPNLPQAASLKMLTQKEMDLEILLEKLIDSIAKKIAEINQFSIKGILDTYHQELFAIHKISTFELPDGNRFSGSIQGVNEQGELLVLQENLGIKSFEVKALKLLY